jgi:hypothetical protein
MNIFRLHDFPLALGNTDAAPVNYPALVKTSHQPSDISHHSFLLMFRRSLLLMLSDHQIAALCHT